MCVICGAGIGGGQACWRRSTDEDEKKWAWELYIYDIEEFKDQLTQYLEGFTTSDAKGIVEACGEHNALDAWRQMAERGFSLRPNHVHELMKKAVFPKAAVQIKDLEMAIAAWEKDVWTYEAASSETIPASQRRLNLLEMCPEQLKKHLKMLGPEKLATYEAMKSEIADWVADEMRSRPSKPRAAALEQSRPGFDNVEIDPEWDEAYGAMEAHQLMDVFLEMPGENLNQPQLNALVKNLKVKKGKGKGKGKPRACFECNSESHIARDCPQRAARVAAGGPERLPRTDSEMTDAGGKGKSTKGGGKGEGKGGKSGKTYPPMAAWKTYNPDPALIKGSQWNHWHPSHMQPQQHLKSLIDDGGWMAAPGAMLSGSLRSLSTRKAPDIILSTRFSALQEAPEPLTESLPTPPQSQTDSAWPELTEPTRSIPKRSLGSTPSGGSPPGSSGPPGFSRGAVGRTPAPRLGERRSAVEPLCGKLKKKGECVQGCCDGKSPGIVQNPNQLRILTERRPQSLMPLRSTEEWEYVEFILDSGATATVIPPNVGKAYAIKPGDASRAGVTYEVANGEEIPNLGEKLMPVVTAEGTWRGLRAQVADVTKALQSVRTLVQAGHMVVFGDGSDGNGNYIINKVTGETTVVKDDGVNYLLGLFIAPVQESGFARPEA